jgi:hypothetical protein
MSKAYYNFIGQYMLDSWNQYWDCKLIVYSEDDLSFLNSEKITYKDWNPCCLTLWEQFCSGDVHESEKKFAKKGFASLDSWKTVQAKKVIWLDADLIFKKEIDKQVLDKILPNDRLIALFTHNYCPNRYEGLSSESGFYIVNTEHKNFKDFIQEYERIYNLEHTPFEISGRGDHKILALVANKFFSEIEDLSNYRTKDKTTTPLNYSWIGDYMNHYKGNVKKQNDFFKNELTKTLRRKHGTA